MKFISKPQVFKIAETQIAEEGVIDMLDAIGADGARWLDKADAPSAGELLVELLGRLCYKSFEVGLNPNVGKIREGNTPYIENILASKHGSVTEHATVTFGFIGVSRVFTHEIVRHRAGTAFAQESLRFVRLDDLSFWMPGVFKSDEVHIKGSEQAARDYTKGEVVHREIVDGVTTAESLYKRLGEIFNIGKMSDFGLKKKLTSAMRRIAPIGLATNIGVTANHRAWRHMIEVRSSLHAEEELRIVFHDVASTLKKDFPNLYQDMKAKVYPKAVDPLQIPVWEFKNSKI